MSYLPRWKFTDSCGQPRAPKTTHVGGCSSDHVPGYHRTRREFFKTGIAIAGAAGFGMILDPREVLAQGRVFPPPPPVAGLMDTHVHTAPDVFGRALDDVELAGVYKERGLDALVLKNHVATTADRAWFARKHVEGLKVFGGIVLNSAVGGINPDAASWMWRMQVVLVASCGSQLSMPTIMSNTSRMRRKASKSLMLRAKFCRRCAGC